MDNKQIARELGRAGGMKTKEKYGTEHYKKMLNKRWEAHRKLKKNEAKSDKIAT